MAVDYSRRSSGLHAEAFDDLIVYPGWEHIDLDHHAGEIAERVGAPGRVWISGLDLEARFLAARRRPPQVLVPPASAMDEVRKPGAAIAQGLGVSIPPTCVVSPSGDRHIGFIDECGWPVWVKGRSYEGLLVADWPALEGAIAHTRSVWGGDALVQAHVSGAEESIVFAAVRGALVGAARMRKLVTTEGGKTWCGEVEPVADDLLARLDDLVDSLGWHGGGEVEFVRTASGSRYLLDVNARFPAWVHGSTTGDFNLPAELVSAALDTEASPTLCEPAVKTRFTRIVSEVPLRDGFELPGPVPASSATSRSASSKHPSGMPSLSRRMSAPPPGPRHHLFPTPAVEAALDRGAESVDTTSTPAYVFDLQGFERGLGMLQDALAATSITAAYSIKTNPDPTLLRLARGAGLLAEAITQDEVEAAVAAGWAPSEVILNGPAKLWPATPGEPVLAMFYDSLEEAEDPASEQVGAAHVGPRIRPRGIRSRFGIALDDPQAFTRAVAVLRRRESGLAIHIHHAQSSLGLRRWLAVVEGTARLGAALAEGTDTDLGLVDVGGGYTPTGLATVLSSAKDLEGVVRACAPRCSSVVIEPGKALLAPHGFLYARVLRTLGDDAVVDASIAELSDRTSLQRPVHVRRSGAWTTLGWGDGAVYGRTCMEEDVITSQVDATGLRTGDLVAFGNAGAYDASMRYHFARGGPR